MMDYQVHGDVEVKILAELRRVIDHHWWHRELSVRSCEGQYSAPEGCFLSRFLSPHSHSCK